MSEMTPENLKLSLQNLIFFVVYFNLCQLVRWLLVCGPRNRHEAPGFLKTAVGFPWPEIVPEIKPEIVPENLARNCTRKSCPKLCPKILPEIWPEIVPEF